MQQGGHSKKRRLDIADDVADAAGDRSEKEQKTEITSATLFSQVEDLEKRLLRMQLELGWVKKESRSQPGRWYLWHPEFGTKWC